MHAESQSGGYRTFLILWATQSVSVIGSALTMFAIGIWLTQSLYPAPAQKAQLATALSVISLARTLPMLLCAPIAGSWADRADRRRIMITANLVNGAVAVMMVALLASGRTGLWPLALLMAVSAVADSFHQAGFDTSYAMLVPRSVLPRANGMMQTAFSLSGILSPGLAAFLVSLPALAREGVLGRFGAWIGAIDEGVVLAVGVDAATFFLSGLVLSFLAIPSPEQKSSAPRRLWSDVAMGLQFLRERPPMLWLLGTFAMANLAFTPLMLFIPLLVKFNLAADWGARSMTFEAAMALAGTAGSLGGLVGGLLISAWGGLKRRRVYGVVIPFVLIGVAEVVVGWSGSLYLTGALLFVGTLQLPVANAHSQSIWQGQTPPELQGRVFAVRRVVAQCTTPVMTAVAGWAGGIFNPGHVLVFFGSTLVLFCALQFFNPHLMQADEGAESAVAPAAL